MIVDDAEVSDVQNCPLQASGKACRKGFPLFVRESYRSLWPVGAKSKRAVPFRRGKPNREEKKGSDVIPAMGNGHRTEACSGLQPCLHDLMSGRSTLSLCSLAGKMRKL